MTAVIKLHDVELCRRNRSVVTKANLTVLDYLLDRHFLPPTSHLVDVMLEANLKIQIALLELRSITP